MHPHKTTTAFHLSVPTSPPNVTPITEQFFRSRNTLPGSTKCVCLLEVGEGESAHPSNLKIEAVTTS